MGTYDTHAYASVIVCVLLAYAAVLVEAGVPLSRYESLMKRESPSSSSLEVGLYNVSDKVIVLTQSNFKSSVLQQNHTTLVEFYNSYCGHCKRFAPEYKRMAEELLPWRKVLIVTAIDCAAEENNDICREYEIMAYPTLRYFGLGFQPAAGSYGKSLESQDFDYIRTTLAQWIVKENNTNENWPNFQPISDKEVENPFEGLSGEEKYVVVAYEPENSTVGIETILALQQYPSVQVRRVTDNDTAAKFHLDGSASGHKVAIVNRQKIVTPYNVEAESYKAYNETIVKALHSLHITERPFMTENEQKSVPLQSNGEGEKAENARILAEVLSNKHLVYQADLEMAIHATLFNEIPKVANISGERLLALQRFLALIKRYNPLDDNGRAFVVKLYEFVMQHNQQLAGKEFEDEVIRLRANYEPVFSANRFVGCSASKSGLRGFTCSLWQLFHYLTVQSTHNEESQDPLEVMQAMHGYVKYFFGCTECSEHFQAMAARRKMWSIPNKDEAVLWLWAAHNEVNQRLSGDDTEDPRFPKIQFPSQSSCSQCYKRPIINSANLDISWDKDAVLQFLKNIHNPEYVSRYGLEDASLLHPTSEKLRQKRMVGNVFSDIDMRMGMLLYGFCIVMMVAAFKLFVFKGYRKKPYGHDFLGKV